MERLSISIILYVGLSTLIVCNNAKFNAARGKLTAQSSTYNTYTSDRAVDGNKTTAVISGYCASTEDQHFSWWYVDLGIKYRIYNVTITDSADVHEYMLRKLTIAGRLEQHKTDDEIRNSTRCTNQATVMGNGDTQTFSCDTVISARYIYIYQENPVDNKLQLCEVLVWADMFNAALLKDTGQKNTFENHTSDRAVDGITMTELTQGSCAKSLWTIRVWWYVDLGAVYRVYSVTITNIGGWRGRKMKKMSIVGRNSLSSEHNAIENSIHCYTQTGSVDDGATETFLCDMAITVRYLYIYKRNIVEERLYLCEVQVETGTFNAARNKHTNQSSTHALYTSDRAVDGDISTDVMSGSCSVISGVSPAWWYVDLGDIYTVYSVRITSGDNALTWSNLRIWGMVQMPLDPQTSILCNNNNNNSGIADGAAVKFTCNSVMDVRYIYIDFEENDNNEITLCEVEVEAECAPGKYGQDCAQTCGRCEHPQECHYITGICQGECEPGYFGMNCTSECGQCKDGDLCEKSTGACPNGCRPGYNPPDCSGMRYGEDPSINTTMMVSVICTCIIIISVLAASIAIIKTVRAANKSSFNANTNTYLTQNSSHNGDVASPYANSHAYLTQNSSHYEIAERNAAYEHPEEYVPTVSSYQALEAND